MQEAKEDFDSEGGTAQFYDHRPTKDEMKKEQDYYFGL